MSADRARVFISRDGVDNALADWLGDIIVVASEERVDVHGALTTDEGGGEWFTRIRAELATTRVCLSLLTPASLSNNWVIFESGYAAALADVHVIPCLHGVDVSDIPAPLQNYDAYRIDDVDSLRDLVVKVLRQCGVTRHERVIEPFVREQLANLDVVPVARTPVRVLGRRDGEPDAGDPLLEAAREATLIALTYKTLGDALDPPGGRPTLRMPRLTKASINVYALPLLKTWHPTIQTKALLEDEWIEGVTRTLRGLMARAPELEHLDLRVLSRLPRATASILSVGDEMGRPARFVRCTHLFSDEPPADTPTLNLCDDGRLMRADLAVFQRYEEIIRSIYRERSPRVFPILRRKGVVYEVSDVDALVELASRVCNHPKFENRDLRFSTSVVSRDLGEGVDPGTVYAGFAALRAEGRTEEFRADFSTAKDNRWLRLTLDGADQGARHLAIGQRHIIGCFVLMTHGNKVFLTQKKKGAWDFDVPGGKVRADDADGRATVQREVFEELGLVLDRDRLSEPIATKYDPLSQKERVPVVAIYHHYALDDAECVYLQDVLAPERPSERVFAYPISRLIAKKRERRAELRGSENDGHGLHDDRDLFEDECHAPLEAIERLMTT